MALQSKRTNAEASVERQESEAEPRGRQDAGAQHARGEWFERQLGEQWQEVEPGIYRFLPAERSAAASPDRPRAASSEPSDVFGKLDELIDDLSRDLHPHGEREGE
jgi:hypothetical protein